MKKLFFFLLSLFLVTTLSFGQLWNINYCASSLGSNLYGPMYSNATANSTSRTAVIFPGDQLADIAGQVLTNLYFNRITATGTINGSPNFKIYLKEVTMADWGATALAWSDAISGATLVYDDNPAPIIGTTAGWKNFPLSTNFAFTGSSNLAMLFEYTGPNVASNSITWEYEYTGPCITTTNNNTTKYINNTTGTLGASLTSSNYRRPNFGVDFIVSCYPPANVQALNISLNSATISWDAPTTAPSNGYEYYYSTSSASPDQSTVPSGSVGAGVTTVNLSGLTSGTVYYVWVRGNCGTADKSIWRALPSFSTLPANDDCIDAIVLPVNAGVDCIQSLNGVTLGATQSSETAPTCSAAGINDDVWYQFTATSVNHNVNVASLNTTAFASQVYSGACGALVAVNCAASSFANTHNVLTGLTIGATYYVRIYSTSSAANVFVIFNICVNTPVGPPPAHDGCATAQALTCGVPFIGNNTLATNDVLPPSTCGSSGSIATYKGVWFTVTPGTSGPITIDACGTYFDSYLRVYTGDCATLTCFQNTSGIGYADGGCPTGEGSQFNASKLTFTGVANQTYYILLTGYSATQYGEYNIVAICPKECTSAPTGGSVTNITSSTADIGWTASVPPPTDGYEYYFSTSATPPTSSTIPSGSAAGTSATLINLTPVTTYYVWVRSYCSAGDFSDWHALPSFTTTPGTGCTASATATPSSICVGENVQLNVVDDAVSYLWSGPNGFTSTLRNPLLSNVSLAMSGTYFVSVTFSDLCVAVGATIITVNPLPNATAGAINTSVCSGRTLNLTSSGGVSYNWSGPSGFTSSVQNPFITNIQTTQAGLYTVTVTSTDGCTATAAVSITVNLTPTATATATPESACVGGSVQFGSSGGATYAWSGPAGFSSSLQNPVRNNLLTTHSGIYTVTVTSANGCTATSTVNLTVNSMAAVSATINPNPVCIGDVATFNANGGLTYNWSGPGGFTFEGKTFKRWISETTMGGVYFVTVTSNVGCTAVTSVNLVVNPLPNGTIAASPQVGCVGQNIQLSATGGTSYVWSGPRGFTSNQQNPVITNPQVYMSGQYSVVITNANGCRITLTIDVKINPTPAATVGFEASTACIGSNLQLYADGGFTYQWSGPAGFSSNLQNPVRNNVSQIHSGVYTVTATNYFGCSDVKSINVTINALPVATASTSTPNLCEGETGYLFSSGGVSYSWSGPWGYTSNLQNPVLFYMPQYMSGTYTVTVTNASGCQATASVNINVQSMNATANASPNPVAHGGTLNLSASGGTFYTWTGPDGFHSYNPSATIHNMNKNKVGYYTCIISNLGGCQATISIFVDVLSEFNGDEIESRYIASVVREVYPNPTSSFIKLNEISSESFEFKIVDLQGKVVSSGNTSGNELIDISNLSSGTYFVRWAINQDGVSENYIGKFIKTN